MALVTDITHRKQAEKTLQQSEERLRIAQQAANAGVWDWDITTNQVTWSAEYYQLYGLDPATTQPSYENWLSSIIELDRDRTDRAAREALEHQIDLNVEFRILHPTQGERWLTAIGQTLFGENGQPKRMTGITLDVTNRKQAEKTLQHYQLLSEYIRDIVLYVDRDGYVLEANQATEQAYGYTRAELLSLRITDLRAPNTLPMLPQQFEQAIREGVLFETIHQRKDGSQFPVEVSAQSAVIDGELVVLSIIRDITERKQSEADLRRSEERFQLIAKATNDVIWDCNLATNKMWRNERLQIVFGYVPEEIESDASGWVNRVHPDDIGRVHSSYETCLNQGATLWTDEYRFRRADGSYADVLDRAYIIRDSAGKPVRVVGAMADITDRKQTEQALRESEEWARLAIQVGRLGGWRLHLDTNLVELDERMREIWGEPEDAVMIPLPRVIERMHPDDRERVVSAVNAAIDPNSLGLYEIDYRIVWDNGIERWVSAKGQARFEGEGESRRTVDFFGTLLDITDRKQAEEALRQSEEKFRKLANAMPQIVWTTNANGEVDYVSQQWFDYAALTLEQTQDPTQYAQVIHPNDLPQLNEQWLQAVESGSLFQTEIRIRRASDRNYRWFLTRAVPVKTEQGQIIAWYGTSTDIDDRKRTEAALQESEQRLQLAQQAGRIGTWEWNVLTDEVSWSDGIWTLLALEPSSMAPSLEAFTRFIHPDDREQVFQRMEVALAQRDDYYDEFRIVRQDGVVCWLLSKGRVIRTHEGQPERLLGINVDISDRKQAEEALRNSAERLSVALAAAKLGDWSWSATTDLLTFSAQAAELFGILPGSYMTWTQMQNLLHPDDRERARLQVEQSIAERSDYDIEYRVIQSNGTKRWIAAKGRAQYDSLGQVLGMLGVVQDITHRKLAEVEREQLLAREQGARREAEQANRIKDEFLAVLSHELRSPLNPILGWAKLLQTRRFDEPATKRALETIERNAKLQTQLIDDLLDVSRILRGKMVLNVCPVDLVTVIDAALETVHLSADVKDIEIQKITVSDIGPILGDMGRLQQIVWNLLSNAVKFTPSGGRVEVRLEEVIDNNLSAASEAPEYSPISHDPSPMTRYAQIQVRDTGKGITPEFLPHVFEYFRQEDSTTTRKFGGLGLGLAIVRYLTELHGGTVKAESPGLGLGATFTVLLPISSNGTSGNLDEIQSSSPVAKPLPLAALRILVVDDDADMRELIFTILEQAGAQVKVTTSAMEVLETLEAFKPDLLISDVGMPEMGGYELLRQIRRRSPEQGGRIPAIALTAYAGEINQQQAIAVGFQRHIAKPVEPEALVKAIVALMKA